MQAIQRWRNVSFLKNSFIHSTTKAAAAASPSSSIHLASFHSTPMNSEKWKNKWNSQVRRDQKPSKNYIRYVTRQKRADAKKALKGLLFNCGCSKMTIEEWDAKQADHSGRSGKKGRSKSSAHFACKTNHNRLKRKFRRENFFDDFDEHPETILEGTFGEKWYTWSFKPWKESFFQSSTSEFNWREYSNWTKSRNEEWDTASETDSDDNSCVIGSSSDRKILGLPQTGALKIEDVKNAFHLSALKWHPDKHQGPSQVMAGEKFKHCVNAYKSLCDALSAA